MKKDLYPGLRKELENTFGRKIISYRDCVQLVDDIMQKTGFTVNVNTLRRFFGLVKTDYKASPSTLTILSKYCGFNSIDEIENISIPVHTELSISKEEFFHYIISLFRQLPVSENYTDVSNAIIEQTIIFLERNPDLTDRFQREMSKIPAGQFYYYEIAVNMDRLNGYYGDGLNYYVRNNTKPEAVIFYHSIQVYRSWLSNNIAGIEKHYEPIRKIAADKNMPPHIAARLVAAKLFYTNVKRLSSDEIISETIKYYNWYTESRKEEKAYSPLFGAIVHEALILTNQAAEAEEFLDLGNDFIDQSSDIEVHPKYSSSFPLRFNKKFRTLKGIILTKKYNRKQVSELLKETGFSKLIYNIKG